MQTEFDEGESLSAIYEKYGNKDIKEARLAYLVGTLKSKELIAKYKTGRAVLVIIMVLVTLLSALYGYGIGLTSGSSTPVYWSAIAIIPLLFLYGFIRNSFQVYLAYIILSITQLPRSMVNFGENLVIDVISLLISVSIIAFVWYLKNKLFPYMAMMGPKKSKEGVYLFVGSN